MEEQTTEKENMEEQASISVLHLTGSVTSLFVSSELSLDALKRLDCCKILTEKILRIVTSHDIDTIFNEDCLLGDKITCRHNLRKWRDENDVSIFTLKKSVKKICKIKQRPSPSSMNI